MDRIQRHAAVASGHFATLFAGAELPPLPANTARLVAEINAPAPDPERLVRVISASPEIAARVIRTVNSSRFALRNRVTSVRHACALLGLRQVKAIALSYAMADALPRPQGRFEPDAFWQDSLTRALLARAFAHRFHNPENEEEAFTCALLADVALPVLLTYWTEYYLPVMHRWQLVPERLSALEGAAFRWTHAQAGAWLLRSWRFPDDMVCFVGVHDLSIAHLQELELGQTIAKAVAVAALLPSTLKPHRQRGRELVRSATLAYGLENADLAQIFAEVETNLTEAQELFGLTTATTKVLVDLRSLTEPGGEEAQ